MPLQSGSDRVLRAMRRSYRREKYLGIIDRVRAAMPDAALSTDIIVGFPGETEDDFAQTLEVVREARFAAAFTFQYSIRPGTPAATMPDQVPPEVVRERYERLVEVVNEVAWSENQKLLGSRVELLVAEGEGRKDAATHRMTGRARDNRLVHFSTPPVVAPLVEEGVGVPVVAPLVEEGALAPVTRPGDHRIRPGDVVEVEITYAAPHHLVADGPVLAHRRTRSGDAWEARTAPTSTAVGLGMPSVGLPA
jgi:tRNA-2-methylthio-N6-dimethylallyladenosine synthase